MAYKWATRLFSTRHLKAEIYVNLISCKIRFHCFVCEKGGNYGVKNQKYNNTFSDRRDLATNRGLHFSCTIRTEHHDQSVEPPDLEVFRSNISPNNPFPAGTRMPMLSVYCEAAAKKRQKVQVEDARKDPVWADSPTAKEDISAYLGFPVFWPSGEVFGTICAVDTKENKWVTPSESLLQTVKDAVEAHLALVVTMEELSIKNKELELTLNKVKTFQGLLPICASCKNIRDDKGYWNQIESYIRDHSEAEFSHSICPDCAKKLYPKIYKKE